MNDVFTPPNADLTARSVADTDTQWAGFWRRAAAYLLDSLVLIIPNILVAIVLPKDSLLLPLAQVLMYCAYKVGLESGEKQATLGKRAMGIKVVGPDGERISVGRALGRFFAGILSGLILGIGFLMAGFTSRKRALHDMIASTYVVRADPEPSDVEGEHSTMPVTWGVWVAVFVMFIFPFGLGLLAAIAIPAYSDYVVRSKMADVVNATGSVKPEAMTAFSGAGGVQSVKPTSIYIDSISIDPGKKAIVATLKTEALGTSSIQPGATFYMVLGAEGGDTWTCGAQGVPNRYLPATCRK